MEIIDMEKVNKAVKLLCQAEQLLKQKNRLLAEMTKEEMTEYRRRIG